MSQLANPFDRELAQHDDIVERLARRVRELHRQVREQLTPGEQTRLTEELDRAETEASESRTIRAKYIQDRDHLLGLDCGVDEVLPGSIVTVERDGAPYTFVLTSRSADSSYPTEGYNSLIGEAIRRRRTGDAVTLADGTEIVIKAVEPGFPMPASDWRGAPPSPDTAERWLAEQRCRDNHYIAALGQRLTEPHVAQINAFVRRLRAERSVATIPFVAPTYGGVRARLLTLMQDPGPKTDATNDNGSGMLCIENYDLSAARQKYLLNQAGIDVSQTISWNAYPWPMPKKPNDESDREAAEALSDFLAICPQLDVVILNGGVANRIWQTLKEIEPAAVEGIDVLPTYHTSAAVITNPKLDPAAVNDDLVSKYSQAATLLDRGHGERIELQIAITSSFPDEEIEGHKSISVRAPSGDELADDEKLERWAEAELIPHTDCDNATDTRELRAAVEVVDAPPEYAKLLTLFLTVARSDRSE